MEKIIEKISTYNIFNYLLPGVVFSVICDKYFSIPLIQESIVNGIFVYYFLGLIISRFGSIIVEPILKKFRILEFADYSDFIQASKKDEKIEVLSEVNNMYRTIVSMIISLGGVALYSVCVNYYPRISEIGKYGIILLIFFLFLFSYKKHTDYISKRVIANRDK